MPAPFVVELTDVVVRYPTAVALDGLTLAARGGEVTAVLGPNGAGKTTMIRCCTGLVHPTSGTIDLLGDAPGSVGASARVAAMPQSTGAWAPIRPRELLTYLGSLYSDPQPVAALMAHLGIDHFARTPYRRLSGGQQQAVNLAAALIGRPEVVFLDEPTAGMDPHLRRRTWDLVRDLRAAGVSVILTTHAMDEASALADQVWIVDQGRVAVSGTVAELTVEASLEDVFIAHTTATVT